MKRLFVCFLAFIFLVMSILNVCAEEEKNKLAGVKWKKLYGDIKITEEAVEGENIVTMSGMNTTYDSMYIDILPAVADMMGDDDSVDMWIVFDIRVDSEVSGEFPLGVRIRAAGVTDKVKEMDDFLENYYSESQNFMNNGKGQISRNLCSDGIATKEWQRVEFQLTFNEPDVNKEFWSKWNLCFDTLTRYKDMNALQIKNMGIYFYEDYESEKEEDTDEGAIEETETEYVSPVTPTPVTVYRPYDFNKYSAGFVDVKEQEDAQVTSVPDATPDVPVDKDSKGTVIIIASAGIAAVIIAVAVILIVNKKRKGESK